MSDLDVAVLTGEVGRGRVTLAGIDASPLRGPGQLLRPRNSASQRPCTSLLREVVVGAAHTAGVRYDELMDAIANTSPTDWATLSPPSVERFRTSGRDDLEVWLAGPGSVAHLRSDLDVSVAWGADQHDGPWDGVWGQWSTFPDQSVYGVWAEILWRGQPVHRQVLASADGGRHYLSAPNAVMKPGTPA